MSHKYLVGYSPTVVYYALQNVGYTKCVERRLAIVSSISIVNVSKCDFGRGEQ
jgi:hypothetical protein